MIFLIFLVKQEAGLAAEIEDRGGSVTGMRKDVKWSSKTVRARMDQGTGVRFAGSIRVPPEVPARL